jgi:hypothetical protein
MKIFVCLCLPLKGPRLNNYPLLDAGSGQAGELLQFLKDYNLTCFQTRNTSHMVILHSPWA